MINCCYIIDREATHEKGLKLTYFEPFCNVEPAIEEDEDTAKDPPSYFDQEFPYTWIPQDIGFQAYWEDVES